MRPVHDVDALVLLATTLSSKRRPTALAEIVAAADMIQGAIPPAQRLGEAIHRLSAAGLIGGAEGGITLTPIAQQIMAGLPKKTAGEALILAVKDGLAAYTPREESPPIQLTTEELRAAIEAHKASRKTPGKNLLMPKAKPDRHFKVEGRWRRAPAARKGKA